MSEKIIIFGGSFDPPHQGHKALVEHVKKLFMPDRFIIVPCFIQPLKGGQSADAQSRLDMVKLLFGSADFLVSDHEIKKGDVSYSIDTIMHFKELFKGLPAIGFATYGEFYISFINQTSVMLVLF